MQHRSRTCLWALCAVALVLAGCRGTQTGRSARGVVAADHRLASGAGAEILSRGGNAVDAAVATCLALSVVRPDASGIGGGGFMLIHIEEHPTQNPGDTVINYRETCPGGIGPDTYERWNDAEASRFGGRAVAVPGSIAGLLHALEKYGTLDRAAVFAPAIRLAESGFPADAHHVRSAEAVAERFGAHPGWDERFAFVWTHLMREGRVKIGDTIRNPDQGRALRLIAERGRAGFYDGPVADAIIERVRGDGGVLTRRDLAGFEVVESEPIRVPWREYTLLVMPPPSSGGIAVAQTFALADLAGLRIGRDGWPDADNAHLLAEIFKHAFADRARHLADPAFHHVPVDAMLDPAALDRVADSIDRERANALDIYGIIPPPEDGGTSHVSVVDSMGNAVACTETINLQFGSLLTVPGFGFCLNNQMDDFTTVRGGANAFGLRQADANLPRPGQRPLSSMSPTIVLDAEGRVFAIAGASGGPRIITSTAQALLRVLLAQASAEEAVRAPRLHHQWSPDTTYFERWPTLGVPESTRDELTARGHPLAVRRDIGAVQLIRRSAGGRWQASSDPRKGGEPAWEAPRARTGG